MKRESVLWLTLWESIERFILPPEMDPLPLAVCLLWSYRTAEEMASRNIFLPKESNRRIPNGTYGGVRGMNNLYSIGRESGQFTVMPVHA